MAPADATSTGGGIPSFSRPANDAFALFIFEGFKRLNHLPNRVEVIRLRSHLSLPHPTISKLSYHTAQV